MYPVDMTKFKVTCEFGKKGPMWSSGWHQGIDFGVPVGTPVVAPIPGTIVGVGMIPSWGPAYGNNSVVLEYASQRYVMFAHLSKATVKVGQVVKVGDKLGLSGAEGNVSGPHLHMEVQDHNGWTRGKAIDPAAVLAYKGPAATQSKPKPVSKPVAKKVSAPVKKAVAPKSKGK